MCINTVFTVFIVEVKKKEKTTNREVTGAMKHGPANPDMDLGVFSGSGFRKALIQIHFSV